MRSKLAGHGLQLAGYALTFLGLGAAAVVIAIAGNQPTIPFWAFVLGAMVIGAPLMIAGGRINSRGRMRVLDQTPEQASREYQQGTRILAVYIGILLLQGFIVALPLFLRAAGFVLVSDPALTWWIAMTMFIFCAGRQWITRPLLKAATRRLVNLP